MLTNGYLNCKENVMSNTMLNIYGETSKIVINGKEYLGQHVQVKGGKIIVDNVLQERSANTGNISVKVYGNVSHLTTVSGDVTVEGDVSCNVTTTSGDVHCQDVRGSIETTSGDVHCQDVRGSIETISGDVSCSTVCQDIHTVSGSISYNNRQ